MDEGLPIEVIKALEDKNRAQLKHKWLWSFMPAEMVGRETSYKTDIFLVGFCPQCNTGVSANIPISLHQTEMEQLDIPKWGCVPVQEIE